MSVSGLRLGWPAATRIYRGKCRGDHGRVGVGGGRLFEALGAAADIAVAITSVWGATGRAGR